MESLAAWPGPSPVVVLAGSALELEEPKVKLIDIVDGCQAADGDVTFCLLLLLRKGI